MFLWYKSTDMDSVRVALFELHVVWEIAPAPAMLPRFGAARTRQGRPLYPARCND